MGFSAFQIHVATTLQNTETSNPDDRGFLCLHLSTEQSSYPTLYYPAATMPNDKPKTEF